MLNVFWWFLTVEAIGLVAFPLAYYLLPRLSDRGFSVSKPLGILLVAYLSWMLSVLHIAPSVRWSITGILVALGGLSTWYAWNHRRELREFVIRERRLLITAEAVFVVVFIGWTIFRAFDPSINHTEQPMDFAFLNAAIDSQLGQPEDPWLRGSPISYYYFGYWMMGSITQLTAIPSNFSYNLSLALIPAMASMGVFGLVYNLIRADSRRWKLAIAGGIGAALLFGVVANLEGVLEFMRSNGIGGEGLWNWIGIDGLDGPAPDPAESWVPQEFWWWFRATRVINTFQDGQGIDYTIQEFPFFSFILGDLHPHVSSIPFVALFLAMSWNFFRSPLHKWRELNAQSYISIVAMGLVLGGIGFTNMWDLPTYAALFLVLAGLKAYQTNGGRVFDLIKSAVPMGIAVIGLGFLFFLPYFLTFRGGIEGIGAVPTTTRPVHVFVIWALFLVAVVPFILSVFWQTTVRRDWRRTSTFALVIGFAPYVVWALLSLQGDGTASGLIGRFFHILPFAALISISVYNIIWLMQESGPMGKVYALALSALGLMMIMGPELLFIIDSFGSRMNTVFKLYYQSWLLLAIGAGFAFYYWTDIRAGLRGWKRSMSSVWAGVFAVLLIGSLYYPPAAATAKGELTSDQATLDGLVFLTLSRPAEYSAIQFLRETAHHHEAMVEAVGEWFDNGLISRSTGVATVFNWPGHELQWRGGSEQFEGRESDIAAIYQTIDAEEARNLLEKYDVNYVYIGPRERDKYGTEGIDKFASFMDEVFRQDDIVIYKTNDS